MFCMNCGTKLPDGARFCFSCGAKIPVTEETQIALKNRADSKIEVETETTIDTPAEAVEEPITFLIHGEKFSVDGSYRNYIAERNRFHKAYYAYIDKITSEQFSTYKDYINSDPDKCVEILSNLGSNVINWGLDSGINFLIEHNIFDVSKTVLSNECAEKMQGYYEAYSKFEDGYLSIIATEEQMEEYRKLKHESRGRWQGGGFGVAGAVKGAAIAGAFNLGGTVLSSINTAITAAIDNSMIQKEKQEFLNKRNWFGYCIGALLSDISVIFQNTYFLLCQKTNYKMPPLNFQKATIYFENIQRATSPQQIISIILMVLKEYPYHRGAHAKLIENLPFFDMDAIRFIEFFQPEGFWRILYSTYTTRIQNEYNRLPEDNYKQLDEKIAYFQDKIDVIIRERNQSAFVEGFATRYLENWQKLCEKLKIRRRTAEDGTILSSVEELEAYQRELKRLNDYIEQAEKEPSADGKQAIWMEAQHADFTFEPLLAQIRDALEKNQEQQTQLLDKYIEESRSSRYSSPLANLSYWRLVYLNLEKGVSTDVRSAVKERLDAAVQQYTGGEMTSRKDGIEEISKEELLGMMSIIANEYRELKGCGEAYVAGTHEKLFTNAYKKIGGNNQDETPLLLIDRSDFENGKRGFVFTDRRLYKNCDYEEEICVSWQDFDSVENHDGKTILLGSGKEICIDHSLFTSHNNASIFLFQTCLKVMHTYRLVAVEKTDASTKTIESIQGSDEMFVKKKLNVYLEEAKEYSTPLEILSFWRIILLDKEEHLPEEVKAIIRGYIDEAAQKYRGNEKSDITNESEEVSKDELVGMMSIIARQYQKNDAWPIYVAGTEGFAKRSINAYKKIGGNNPDEVPLLLLDMTILGSGKSGYVLTDRHLYKAGDSYGSNSIPWQNISTFECSDGQHIDAVVSFGEKIRIDGNTVESIIANTLLLLKKCQKVMNTYRLKN